MTYSKFYNLCILAYEEFKKFTPVDTGNLRYNAVRFKLEDRNTFVIYIDESIAPYVKYTVGKWEHKYIQMGNFRPGEVVTRFRTWDNPNEGWMDKAVQIIAKVIASKVGGVLSLEKS